jgi:pimeloyl-ACP methyl ester carboxylesterase
MMAGVPPQGFVEAGAGVQLFYRVDGHASRAVVVLHGGPGFSHDYLADELLPLAHTHGVIHYDQRGSGRSSAAPTHSTHAALPTTWRPCACTSAWSGWRCSAIHGVRP